MENIKTINFTYDSSMLDLNNIRIGSIQCLFDELNSEAELFESVCTLYPCTREALLTEAEVNNVDVYDYALSMLEEIGGDLARLRLFDSIGIVSVDCVKSVRIMLYDLRCFYTDFIRTSAIWKG